MTNQYYPYYFQQGYHCKPAHVKCDRILIGNTMPVTAQDVMTSINLFDDGWSNLISDYIKAATRLAEIYCNKSFSGSSFTQYQSHFDRENYIWYPSLNAITGGIINYFDAANTAQTLTVNTDIGLLQMVEDRSVLFFVFNQIIPFTTYRPDAVSFTFTTTPSNPDQLVMAIKLQVGTWFDRRSNEQEVNLKELNIGVKQLLDQLKVGQIT